PGWPAQSPKHGRPLMIEGTLYVGLDTGKNSIEVAVAEPLPGGEVRFVGKIANTAAALDRMLKRLARDGWINRRKRCPLPDPCTGLRYPSTRVTAMREE